jgi:flavin reductase (DIM6/NTAB) family NADH-FMN oxidoreductase RutF
MLIDLKELSPNQIYYQFIQTLIPRPIAWILTDNGNGTYNLAPFSYFNGISSNPPLIFVSIGVKPDGSKKDTWLNIEERNHFIVHIPSVEHIKEVNESSATLPHGESEIHRLNLDLEYFDSSITPLPRIKNTKIAFICEKFQIIEIGDTPQGLILGTVKHLFIDDSCIEKDTKGRILVNPKKVNPLARLGASTFASLGELLELQRPL